MNKKIRNVSRRMTFPLPSYSIQIWQAFRSAFFCALRTGNKVQNFMCLFDKLDL